MDNKIRILTALLIIFLLGCGEEKIIEVNTDETAEEQESVVIELGNPQEPPEAEPGVQDRTHSEGEICGGIAGFQCAEGLYCWQTEFYPDAAGTCVNIDQAKTNCDAAGGLWEKFGRLQMEQCNLPTEEGKKQCTASSECEIRCILDEESGIGYCQDYRIKFGCFTILESEGVNQTICID
jgi:hypothetical protein